MRQLTVGQLKQLIYKLRDDTAVLVPAPDHSYRPARAEIVLARLSSRGDWSEDDGDEKLDNELGSRYQALIIQ